MPVGAATGFDDGLELVARLRVALRRAGTTESGGPLRLGPLEIDEGSHSVRRDGTEWTQSFVLGKPAGPLKKGQKVKGTGTTVTFRPDPEIFGPTLSLVSVKDEKGKSFQYTIVGSTEADPSANRLSNESPVGKALIGRKKGDTVSVPAPKGERKLTIAKISVA